MPRPENPQFAGDPVGAVAPAGRSPPGRRCCGSGVPKGSSGPAPAKLVAGRRDLEDGVVDGGFGRTTEPGEPQRRRLGPQARARPRVAPSRRRSGTTRTDDRPPVDSPTSISISNQPGRKCNTVTSVRRRSAGPRRRDRVAAPRRPPRSTPPVRKRDEDVHHRHVALERGQAQGNGRSARCRNGGAMNSTVFIDGVMRRPRRPWAHRSSPR